MSDAEKGIATRPFIVMYDAYAWALHRNGRDTDALTQIDIALSTGMNNALFHFHKGMIEFALGDLNAARTELNTAMQINPTFSPLDAPIATATLAQLGTAP